MYLDKFSKEIFQFYSKPHSSSHSQMLTLTSCTLSSGSIKWLSVSKVYVRQTSKRMKSEKPLINPLIHLVQKVIFVYTFRIKNHVFNILKGIYETHNLPTAVQDRIIKIWSILKVINPNKIQMNLIQSRIWLHISKMSVKIFCERGQDNDLNLLNCVVVHTCMSKDYDDYENKQLLLKNYICYVPY